MDYSGDYSHCHHNHKHNMGERTARALRLGTFNLNEVKLPYDWSPDGPDDATLENQNVSSGDTRAYFRDLEYHLCEHIRAAPVALGAVAWLTSEPILNAMRGRDVAVVVQKEDFLRPDYNTSERSFKARMRRAYDSLSCGIERYAFESPLSFVSMGAGSEYLDPVRCVGVSNTERARTLPRMHNKFMLFANLGPVPVKPSGDVPNPSRTLAGGVQALIEEMRLSAGEGPAEEYEYYTDGKVVVPYAVWTGSFNFTHNAGKSFENALYTTNPEIVQAYYLEWCQIMALSEPLDWSEDWVCPEWRVGT